MKIFFFPLLYVVVVVYHCVTSIFGTNDLLSDISVIILILWILCIFNVLMLSTDNKKILNLNANN